MFQIGEFAHLGGVSAKALRLYDERGIFRPAWVDPSSGYRYYSPAQLPSLRRIVALRDLGIPLAEIHALVVEGADLREALARRREELEAERRIVGARLADLDIRVEMADDGPDVVVRDIPAERVAAVTVDALPGLDVGPLFYEVEEAVRDAGARAPRPPGVLIDRTHATQVQVFVPVRGAVTQGRVTTTTLPALRGATVLHRGPYAGMGETRAALHRWVTAAGYAGPTSERIVYLQFGAEPELAVPDAYVVASEGEFLTEVQVPIG